MAEAADLSGAIFEITIENPLVVNVPDPVGWSGEVEDSAVAEFIPGRDDGSAVFNPGFEAVGTGSTGASLTGPDGDEYAFTIVVR